MPDVKDYLRRMFAAIFLCPIATAFWIGFALTGFSFDALMLEMGAWSQQYAAMATDAQAVLHMQVLFFWGILAFAYLLLSFVTTPPRFDYRLKKENDHWVTNVVGEDAAR